MTSLSADIGQRRLTLADKFRSLQWGLVILIAAISGVGFAMLYSAANGSFQPWASRQMARFAVAFLPMLLVAVVDIRHWFRSAYWIYGTALVLVIAVDLRGFVGMGAQRWIDLGFIQLQPSEIMTIALVLALGRYFHCVPSENVGRFSRLIPPVLMILIPTLLVLKQPDLGTAMLLLASGAILCFLGGVKLRMFVLAAAGAGVAAPIVWRMLRDYQRTR
ncbi:MAG: FtsW/RodA/SpoVE family cell cycle protein, partial [Alphaproteobacteria bacterium]|nr:FtsW/RodA/SpoVE family cell cycle protein [Alphaproteobacteria bacterium]